MADRKFENMPGIDFNSPSVYETTDLPEDDQNQAMTQLDTEENENIENCKINTNKSYEKFKGKALEASDIDFSDRISHFRRTGYESFNVYEIQGENETETHKQKLQRLKHEIQVLTEDLAKAQQGAEANVLPEINKISNGTDNLQRQLEQLKLDDLLDSEKSVSLQDPTGLIYNQLMKEIETFKIKSKNLIGDKNEVVEENCIRYQLLARPQQDRFSDMTKLTELEERLEKLEKAIGNSPENMKLLASQISGKSLVASCQHLASQISLLQPDRIDAVEARLQSVMHTLNQLKEQSGPIEEDKVVRLNELKTTLDKYSSVVDAIPNLVQRLVTLQDLHEHASQFNTALKQLENSQSEIDNLLKNRTTEISLLKSTMEENVNILQEQSLNLEKRIKSLQK